MNHFDRADIAAMDRKFRMNLIQSLPGFKTANLIGTVSQNGQFNLAIFSSVIHLGSSPPLLGFKMRPTHVQRDTYQNILETGFFTLNSISPKLLPNAHWTSEKMPPESSEFEVCQIEREMSPAFPAPFVKASPLKMMLKFVEDIQIKANGTHLIVGEIQEIFLKESALEADGHLDFQALEALAIGGPDRYYTPQFLLELPYGMPDNRK